MDKNVGSVNLDELKAAREALDRERGIETDPNMYEDYNPEKHKAEREQEKLDRENATSDVSADEMSESVNKNSVGMGIDVEPASQVDVENKNMSTDDDAEIIVEFSAEEQTRDNSILDELDNLLSENSQVSVEEPQSSVQNSESAKSVAESNLSIYDTFSDFEINSADTTESVPKEAPVQSEEASSVSKVSLSEIQDEKEYAQNDTNLDDFLTQLDSILTHENEENVDDEKLSLPSLTSELPAEEINANENSEVLEQENVENQIIQTNSIISENVENDEDIISEINENTETEVIDNSQSIASEDNIDQVVDSLERFDTEILTDINQLGAIASEIEAEKNKPVEISDDEEIVVENEVLDAEVVDTSNDENSEEIVVGGYTQIEDFNFVDVISDDEFKMADKFSYILGKDDEGEIVYGNLRDTCGTVVYSKNEESVFEQFNSMILSLILKNTPKDIQFVICDAMFDSPYDIYNNSPYMFLNRVAKNNREIVDSLIELSKELENRYNNLVYAGVKSISAFNLQAEERGAEKMPYVVLLLNNYAKTIQFLDSDRINTCLHNILKFGRLVGVYVVIASSADIERTDINYNLPTRICYKCETADDSVMNLGREGAELLTDSEDFLYSTVYDEEVKHLKAASLTKEEIKIIIENLEN